MTDPPDWMVVEMNAMTLGHHAININMPRRFATRPDVQPGLVQLSKDASRARAYMQVYEMKDENPRLYGILMAREHEPGLTVDFCVSDVFAADPNGPCKDCTLFMSRDGVKHEFAFSLLDTPKSIIKKYTALSAKFPRPGSTKAVVVVSGRRVKT